MQFEAAVLHFDAVKPFADHVGHMVDRCAVQQGQHGGVECAGDRGGQLFAVSGAELQYMDF